MQLAFMLLMPNLLKVLHAICIGTLVVRAHFNLEYIWAEMMRRKTVVVRHHTIVYCCAIIHTKKLYYVMFVAPTH